MLDKDGLATRIKKLRGAESRLDFGRRYGVTPGQVGHWETGHSNPDLKILVLLSMDYNVSADFILKGDNTLVKIIQDPEKAAMKTFMEKLKVIQKEMENFRQQPILQTVSH